MSTIRRKVSALAFSGALACGALTAAVGCSFESAESGAEGEVEAEVAVAAAAGFVVNFYQNVFKVAGFMKKKPEDPATVAAREISARIDSAKTEILAALADARWADRKLNGASIKGEVRTVLDNFRAMTQMPPTDPDLVPLRRETQTKAADLLNYFEAFVENGNEPQLAYDTAQAYNALLVTYIGILKIKGEITPAAPAATFLFSDALSRGMQANYKLIGSRRQACSGSQYIPRRNLMYVGKDLNLVQGDLVGPIESNTTRKGLFFQLFTDYWYTSGEHTCNIKRNECTAPSYYEGSNNGLPQRCDGPQVKPGMANAFKFCLERAANRAASKMNEDPVVNFVRTSMESMLKLGAVTVATTGGGFPGTNPAVGSYFDPVIHNPYVIRNACEAGRRTYVISP